METKYASDLKETDQIVDRHSGRLIKIDRLEPIPGLDKVHVDAYFEDNGDDWTRDLDFDSQLKVT